ALLFSNFRFGRCVLLISTIIKTIDTKSVMVYNLNCITNKQLSCSKIKRSDKMNNSNNQIHDVLNKEISVKANAMNSKSARSLALLFVVIAVAGAAVCGALSTISMAIGIAAGFISLAVVFLIFEGLLKNQETLILLEEEKNKKLAEIISVISKSNENV
ncbi:MAG: hypothetical protein OSJ54_13325, partial [Oscillospiraceae bacterium]|nr:hypothetical protein [Oscillospiraceae bacterium]